MTTSTRQDLGLLALRIGVVGAGLIALTGCGLQPATAYVPDGPEDDDLSFAETEQY